jgi:flagellin-like hook-associated protein FlgL
MNKTEIIDKISLLREVLADSVLTSADLVAIRNEIGELQDELTRIDSQES